MYKRIKEINQRKDEIKTLLQSSAEFDADAISAELDKLTLEERNITNKMELLSKTEKTELKPIESKSTHLTMEETMMEARSSKEYRTAFFTLLQKGQGNLSAEQRNTLQIGNAISNGKNIQELRFDSGASGGAAIPTITLDMVIQKLLIISAVYPFVSKYNVKGNLKLPFENVTAEASWTAEGNPVEPSSDTITSFTLAQYDLIKTVQISRVLEQLSIDAFEAYIVDKLFKKLMVAIENAILNGTGASYTQPLGILNAVTFNGSNSISYPSLASMDYSIFTQLKAKLPAPYHINAKFVINPNTLYNGIALIRDALGRPIFLDNPQYGLTSAEGGEQVNYQQTSVVGRILGNPVILSPYIADGVILLGDLNFYHFNMSKDILIEKSYEYAFISNDVVYKGWLLGDGNVSLQEAFVKASIA